MSALKTLYRTVIMLATVVVVVQGWHLYGPTNEQVKSIAARVIEAAHRALDSKSPPGGVSLSPLDDPRNVPPPFAELAPVGNPAVMADPHLPIPFGNSTAAQISPPAEFALDDAAPSDSGMAGAASGGNDDLAGLIAANDRGEQERGQPPAAGRFDALLAWLAEQGVREPKLEPWGSSGRLYRFSCRAPWGAVSNFSRPIEAIAEEPLLAVEQVAAKVRQLGLEAVADNGMSVNRGPSTLAR